MNTKKTALLCAFTLFASSNYLLSDSQKHSGTVVVTINGQKVIHTSKAGQEINEKLLKEKDHLSKPLQEDEKNIIKKEQELQSKKKNLDKEAEEVSKNSLLSTDAKQRKYDELQEQARRLEEDRAELERLIKRFQSDAKRLEGKMSQMYQEEMSKFDATIKDTIKTLSIKEGWDIVLMEESIIYSSPSTSKTDVLVKELDNRHQSSHKTSAAQLEKELKKDEQIMSKLEHARG